MIWKKTLQNSSNNYPISISKMGWVNVGKFNVPHIVSWSDNLVLEVIDTSEIIWIYIECIFSEMLLLFKMIDL